jgi:hypothetical protein
MVHEHGQFIDTVGDAVIRLQDEAYRLGNARAKADAAALVAVAGEALASMSVSFRDPDLRARMQAALDAAKVVA